MQRCRAAPSAAAAMPGLGRGQQPRRPALTKKTSAPQHKHGKTNHRWAHWTTWESGTACDAPRQQPSHKIIVAAGPVGLLQALAS